MARWELTISDPQNTIPPLVLRTFADGYDRSIVQQISLAEYTQQGNPILQGTATPQMRFTWAINGFFSEDDVLHLMALIEEQQRRFAALGSGHLILADEMEYLPPTNVVARQKPIVPGTVRTIVGQQTGFPLLPVMIAIDKTPPQAGTTAGGEYYKALSFTMTELLGVA